MPKRSNEFQRILTAVHQLYAPKGAKITPSAMLQTTAGELREIDILVEIPTDFFTVKVAIEAKDHGRKIEFTAIDGIIGKFTDLLVSEKIIVAPGFAKTAKKRAERHGIKCHTLETLKLETKGTFNRQVDATKFGQAKGNKPKVKIAWGLCDYKGQLVDKDLAHNGIIYNQRGQALGRALDIARKLRPDFPEEVDVERKKIEGCWVKGELFIEFTNHHIRKGISIVNLGRLSVSTSGMLILPDLKATSHMIEGDGLKKEIISETATNEFGHYTIVHEKNSEGKSPNKIQVYFTDKSGNPGTQNYTHTVRIVVP